MSLQSYKGYEKKRMEKNALYTYAVRLPKGLMPTEVFNQLLNGEIYEEDIEDDTELPNFSLGFDFMALCSELPKTSVEL